MRDDEAAVRTLLELDGQVIDQEDGYWVKIDAWRVEVTEAIPHGIRYSLTLHQPDGERVLGYDNAHSVPGRSRRMYLGRRAPFDHRHRLASRNPVPYEFHDAYQLLADFFQEVDAVLRELKGR